jgi:hypothetical protein
VFPARWLGWLGRSRVCQAGLARSPGEIEMRSQGSDSEWPARDRPECHTRPRRIASTAACCWRLGSKRTLGCKRWFASSRQFRIGDVHGDLLPSQGNL